MTSSAHPAARRRVLPALATVCALTLLAAGCSGGGARTGTDDEPVADTKALDAASDADASGDITVCGGKDNGVQGDVVDAFSASQDAVKATYVALGPDTDKARTAAVQRLEGGSDECDVYLTDVTWTAEWASQGWLYDQTELVSEIGDGILPSVLATTEYGGKNWGTPFYTNAALILYNSDLVDAPDTWTGLFEEAEKDPANKIFLQLKPYEGLTVGFLEFLYSAGGGVLDDDGNVIIDSDQTRTVLQFLKDGLDNGAIDKASLTYDEAATMLAFQAGDGAYERNWPNAYVSAQTAGMTDNLGVAALPAFDESTKPDGVLGGWNFAVPLATKNPGGAVAFIKYASGEEFQKQMMINNSQASVRGDVYSDADVQAAIPFASTLLDSVEAAQPRPTSPVYAQISSAIYTSVYEVLNNGADIDETVTQMAADIEKAQDTF
ncbi:MAG: ABC transporter substrate-binding protein [Microbacterium sp.]